ncbi:endonuclease [Bacillus sp. Hm123]|uniref:endonuclease n=1 Tax=Bacillus sp. Hm123 TaxID=3450745 RepID=UPI003F41DD07
MSKNKWKKSINSILSATLAASLLVPIFPATTKASTAATDLIISEYIEGGSYNKAIELYNGTGKTIDLSTYTLELHSNGATTATNKVELEGTLENNDVYVIHHNDAAKEIKDHGDLENSSVINFNGDDPIVLRKDGAVVDSIGQANGLKNSFVSDATLVRKSSITSGDTNIEDTFDVAAEWNKFNKDTFTQLGQHQMDGSTTPDPTEPVDVTSATITGTAKVGETLTAAANDGATNVTYQWQAADTIDGTYTNIEGATKATLALTAAQEGKFIKVIINGDNESTATSNATEQVTAADPTQVLSIANARAKSVGEEVVVKATVTAKLKNTIAVEDETGGMAVRPTSLDVAVGDEVTLSGTIAEFKGLLQLDSATIVEKNVNAGALTPKEVTGADVNEDNESELVAVKNVEIKSVNDGGSWANYTVTDGTTEFIVRDETGELELTEGMKYDSITGIIQQYNADYQIIPRSQQDIVADSSVIQPAFANPGSGTFVGGTTVTLSANTAGAEIYYTLDGTEPTKESTKYTTAIEITEDTTIKAVAITAKGSSEVRTFDYKITDGLQIHDIQGASHETSFDRQMVENIQGVVTYSFKLGSNNYYHIQTPDELADNDPKTSEGIVLYSGKNPWPIEVGDLVSVTGEVSEYAIDGFSDKQETDMKTTQISVRDDRGGKVEVLQSGVELPKPIVIDETNLPAQHIDSDELGEFNPEVDAIDFWESIEGMRVEVDNVKAVAPQEHGDLITVLENRQTNSLHGGVLLEKDNQNADRIQFRLEPNSSARDFEVATGDKFTGPIEGVVGYSFQNYKIYVGLDEMEAAHVKGKAAPEQTTIVKNDKKLTIASYNLENFSNNYKTTSDDKAQKLARAIATDMQSPDIVGVTEVQDNNGPDAGDSKADQSYQRLIATIANAGGPTYEYVNVDPEYNQDGGQPGANIRVGFLYNPDRVSLTDGMPQGDATTAVGYENGQLTHNPGRIDPNNSAFNSSRKPLAAQFDFQGDNVIVIANHWNSKGGDTPLFGSQQPPVYKSEVQRKQIATIVANFIKDVKTENPDANIVSLGDFNDFQFSDALKIHEGEHMTNMINKVETPDRYTYVYQGNSQVLDHILVSKNLEKATEVDILHINADFTDMAGRASDHDPVLVQVSLTGGGVTPEPIKPEKEYNLTNFKTKKLKINSPSVAINVDESSVIKDGIWLKGAYAELQGAGLSKTKVTIQPTAPGAIIDFKGAEVREVIIEKNNVKEIRGAENIKNIKYEKGATPESIKFTDSQGEPIGSPSFPEENKAPILKKDFINQTVKVGDMISLPLSDYFSDPDNDRLTFTSTKGTVDQQTGTLTLMLEEGSHIVAVTATDGKASITASFGVTVKAEEVPSDDYYKDAYGKTGSDLKAALHEIIDDHTQLSYSDVWQALRETDEDPNNPNNVILLYSGKSRSKSLNGGDMGDWNREHVWAKSHGDFGTSKGPGTDIHHLRPTDVRINSTRGNLDFDNGGSSVSDCNGCYRSSNSWEPPDRVKGDVARMIFYMAVRYESGDRVDLELNERLNNGKNPYHGKKSVLLEWHKQDPVDDFEKNRNNVIQEWQGNRNPFIDHPEWAAMIW